MAHDPAAMFPCPICLCRFTTQVGLKSHNTLIHKKQSASYDNIEIVEDEGGCADNEPDVDVDSSYPQQNENVYFCEESEPIIQGILETDFGSNGLGQYSQQEVASTDASHQDDGLRGYEYSEPIIQGILEYSGSQVIYTPATIETIVNKKKFSPKSRPIKCSMCASICYGPESLRYV